MIIAAMLVREFFAWSTVSPGTGFLVGGEPLVRFRELTVLLPQLEERGIFVRVVTSAVRPIPDEWRRIRYSWRFQSTGCRRARCPAQARDL